MDQVERTESKKYHCACRNVVLEDFELADHLALLLNHKIAKIQNPTSHSKKYKKAIFNQIQTILKIQIQIQQTSDQIIKTVVLNTSMVIENLNRLIKFYRDLLLDPQENSEVEKKDIASVFKLNQTLSSAIESHFGQKAVTQINSQEAIRKNVKSQVNQILNNHCGAFWCMEVFRNERYFVTGGNDGAIRIWDLQTNSQIDYFLKHKGIVRSIALGSADELILSGSDDMTVRLWNVRSKTQLHIYKGHTRSVESVLF